MGWAEVAAGVGLTIGPVIGSIIYEFTNYLLTFAIYGGILLLGTLVLLIGLPSNLNKEVSS